MKSKKILIVFLSFVFLIVALLLNAHFQSKKIENVTKWIKDNNGLYEYEPTPSWLPNFTKPIYFSFCSKNIDGIIIYSSTLNDISKLSVLDHLTSLDISGSDVSDLSPIENLNSLRLLNISNTNVKDLSILFKLHSLQTLTLEESLEDNHNLKEFRKVRPECEIIYSNSASEIHGIEGL